MIKPASLKTVLLAHELAFLLLVAVAGGLSGTWAFFWQKNAAESVRLNDMSYQSLLIRSDLFRQIKEVLFARVMENPEAFDLYSRYSRQIDDHFNALRQLAQFREEEDAIQGMQQAYRLLQNDMNHIFADPYLPTREVQIKMFDPRYEKQLVGGFESAWDNFTALLTDKKTSLDEKVGRGTRRAPYLLILPLLLAVTLTIIARRWLQRGVLKPMAAVMDGAQKFAQGELTHTIPTSGVSDMAELSAAINSMAGDLAHSRDALVESEKNSVLGALVPVVAHNIRNPLASIRASVQLLEHADSAMELKETKQVIIDTVDRLGRWVSSLVSYLHPLKPHFVLRSPALLVEAALGLLTPRLNDRKLTVVRGVWDGETRVAVDPDLMEQALYGLLSNAVDASPRDATLMVSAEKRDEEFIITIQDQGAGMPFQPEPKGLAPGPTTKRLGTGLGIPVAFKVCRAHGWQLQFATPASGSGTCIVVTAPLKNQLTGEQA